MIPCRNIYYMLAYAFQTLNEHEYRKIALEEDFENSADLLAALLCRGVATQVKRGLMHEYCEREEALASPRGKLNVSDSIKTMSVRKKQIVCEFDEFTVNAYNNRIIKTAFAALMRAKIPDSRKKEIKKLLVYFAGVDTLVPNSINWTRRYDRNNQTYQTLVSLCYLILKGLLQTTESGSVKMMEYIDEQRMCRLYEKFILEYFRRHYSPQIKASAAQIPWALDEACADAMLPTMQSDIYLSCGNKILIIDAKYYSHTTQVQFGKHTLHSNNLYQIFTYVKNTEARFDGQGKEVSGMLLYAKTDEEIQPDNMYRMSGNTISVKTLDLNRDFKEIAEQLNTIAESICSAD